MSVFIRLGTDSSFGIAPRICVTLRKSFYSRSIQFVIYIINRMRVL